MTFSSGMDKLQEAIDKGKRSTSSGKGGNFAGKSLNYFNWKPGDKKILRFLSDDLLVEDFYDFILDKTGQTKNFMVPPGQRDPLARYRSATPGIGWRRDFKSGQLEIPLPVGERGPTAPRKLGVNIAVLRDEVHREGRTVVEDYLYDKELDGVTLPSRYFGLVQQSPKNFWSPLVSCFSRYGTLCDRDYEITRVGSGFDTQYTVIPLPEVTELKDPEVVRTFYGYGETWNPEDPQRLLKCPMTLPEWAEYFSGEERYAHWLTPDGQDGGHQPYAPPPGDEAQAQVSKPVSGTAFATLQDELLSAAKKSR